MPTARRSSMNELTARPMNRNHGPAALAVREVQEMEEIPGPARQGLLCGSENRDLGKQGPLMDQGRDRG
jgi:hypothetical protein